jgi:hypothetical protein
VGIIQQVYLRYTSHMPELKSRTSPESEWQHHHMTCTHMQSIFNPPFPLAVSVLITGLQSDCEQACKDAEFVTYEADFVRCW